MSKLFNFNEINDEMRNLVDLDKIYYNKLISSFLSKAREDGKSMRCLSCKKETTQFCNSHLIPASFLKNIASNGSVFTSNKILEMPILEIEKGMGKSGTFRVICRDCDSYLFQDYENQSNYKNEITSRMVAQIAMKNFLGSINKRRLEISLYNNVIKNSSPVNNFNRRLFCGLLENSLIDLNEYLLGFNRAKKVSERNLANEYYIFYYTKLDYTVPIAFQGQVCLPCDLLNNTINNVYSKQKCYKMQHLHISVFPFKDESVVMMFIDKNSTRYRSFCKQFNRLESCDKLAIVNFLIFILSEDVFMNKNVSDVFLKNEKLRNIAGLTSVQFSDKNVSNELLNDSFNFSEVKAIPNFLLKDKFL